MTSHPVSDGLCLQESAARRLQQLLEDAVDVTELQRAVERARALRLPPELVAPAQVPSTYGTPMGPLWGPPRDPHGTSMGPT